MPRKPSPETGGHQLLPQATEETVDNVVTGFNVTQAPHYVKEGLDFMCLTGNERLVEVISTFATEVGGKPGSIGHAKALVCAVTVYNSLAAQATLDRMS